MRKVLTMVLVAATALICATASSAEPEQARVASADEATANGDWSLAEKQYWVKLQEEMDDYVKRANSACGTTKIKGSFDKESFRGHFSAEAGSYGLDGYARAHCMAGPGGIAELCGNDLGKGAVQEKVTAVECKWGGKDKQAIGFTKGKLLTTIDPVSGNDNAASYQVKVVDYLKSKL